MKANIFLLLNGALVLLIYLGYARTRKNRAISELGLDGCERTRKRGVDAFGVPAFRYRDMLLSVNYLRSTSSIFAQLADGKQGTVVVLWFPEPLGAPFVITDFPQRSSVLRVNGRVIAFEAKAVWKEKSISLPDIGVSQLRWAVLDPATEEMLLSERGLEVLSAFAAAVKRFGATLRIEERGITIIAGSAPLDQLILQKGYDLWENLKDKKLPKSSYQPLRSGWNVLVLLLIVLFAVVIAATIIAQLHGR